ncbi:MAG: hypothetical protein NT087_05160 [Deltaproteobacteria bacterium]|nr:hypothetical protein [Deltaproteobacteria bacterium]
MPIILEFDSAHGVLRAAATGLPALGEFRQAMEQITSGVHYPPTVPTIWDLRALDFANIDSQAIRKISASLAGFPARKNVSIAYVVADQLGYGMMRMWQSLTETADNSRVFYDYDKADQWISAAPHHLCDPHKELDLSAYCQFARAIKAAEAYQHNSCKHNSAVIGPFPNPGQGEATG